VIPHKKEVVGRGALKYKYAMGRLRAAIETNS
jgi:hypothetical protein